MTTLLVAEPVKQPPWYLQIQIQIAKSKRPTDRMSIAQSYKIFEEEKFLCDDCCKPNDLGWAPTVLEHVIHITNPVTRWACGDCMDQMRNKEVYWQKREGETT
jgi:hypothetical protein